MKSLKLFVSVATACLLVGASGTVMAVDCAGGIIENTTVDSITIDGQSCFINEVFVNGDVIVRNSEELVMVRNNVVGNIRVLGGRNVTLVANSAKDGSIVVRSNERALLVLNNATETIRVIRTGKKATVKRNLAAIAIVCRNNGRLDAFENEAPEMRCRSLGGGFDGFGGF
jgi:hypothetical protein